MDGVGSFVKYLSEGAAMKLRVRAMGLAIGMVLGLAAFLGTLYSLWLGGGTFIGNLVLVIPGYQRSYVGAFIGLIGGFVWGLVGGALLAWFYNIFYKAIYKSGPTA
jgi:hypothetical protein